MITNRKREQTLKTLFKKQNNYNSGFAVSFIFNRCSDLPGWAAPGRFHSQEFKIVWIFEMTPQGASGGPLGRPDGTPGLQLPTGLAGKRGGSPGGRGGDHGPRGRPPSRAPA